MDEEQGLLDSLKRHWRALSIFTVLVAAAAIWSERHFFPDIDVIEDENAPVTPAMPVAPEGGKAEEKNGDKSADPKIDSAAQAVLSQTVTVDSRPAAVLKVEGKWADSPKLLAEAFAKLKAAVNKAGLATNGKPISVFTRADDKGFAFEAMLPLVKAPDKPKLSDGVEIGASPSGKALKFQHRGSYDEIDATYEAIAAYLEEKGLDTKEAHVEEFLSDFRGDDGAVEIDIYVFLKDASGGSERRN